MNWGGAIALPLIPYIERTGTRSCNLLGTFLSAGHQTSSSPIFWVITDVPSTLQRGHDGIVQDVEILNDETIARYL